MQPKIETIVDGMLHEMESYGLTQSTIRQYRRGFCRGIINFFHIHGDGSYSDEVLEGYVNKYEAAFSNGYIKRHHYLSELRTLRYLKEYAETGRVNFKRMTDRKKFKPSNEALVVIEQALSESDLKENFKYKLHVCLRHFYCFIEQKNISIITDKVIRDFISYAYESNKNSMEYIVYSMNFLAGYLNRNGLALIKTDFHYFKPRSAPVRLISPYTQEEIGKIVSYIDTSTPEGKRNRAIILLTFNTGLRGIDIVNLKLDDISWKTGEISIVQSKTSEPLRLPINGMTMNAVAEYILHGRPCSESRNVFLRVLSPHKPLNGTSTLDGIITNLCLKAGVEIKYGRSFHSLRRSFATGLSEAEVALTIISQMMGHRDIDSDRPYLSFNRTQTSMCAMDFEEIPLKGGIYAVSQTLGQNDIYSDMTHPGSCHIWDSICAMGFNGIPLMGGVYA